GDDQLHQPAYGEDHLGGTPADVDDRGPPVPDVVMTTDAAQGQAGFLFRGNHVDADSAALPGFANEFPAIGGFPDRTRRDGTQLVDSESLDDRLHPAQHTEGVG